jgi:hypothetical protein
VLMIFEVLQSLEAELVDEEVDEEALRRFD